MKFVLFIIISIISLAVIYYLFKNMTKENYTNLEYSKVPPLWNTTNPTKTKDNYWESSVLLNGSYPLIMKNCVNMKDQYEKWWHYPIFKLGSYKQITNNIRYPNNPDNATSTPGLFSGALYHKSQYKSNISTPLEPVSVDVNKVRINYYNADNNMLPFVGTTSNILY